MKSSSALETKKLAGVVVLKILRAPTKKNKAFIIKLNGELGAGKTTFTQGFAKALGVSHHITSPTFVIMRRYGLKKNKKYENLYHIDAYRMKRLKEMHPLNIKEVLTNPKNIVLVEWAKNIEGSLLRGSASIKFAHGKTENERVISTSLLK
jgi:tRNA threonylcarbamoyladenosine biosynthesis protein TsaE